MHNNLAKQYEQKQICPGSVSQLNLALDIKPANGFAKLPRVSAPGPHSMPSHQGQGAMGPRLRVGPQRGPAMLGRASTHGMGLTHVIGAGNIIGNI